MKKKIEDNVGYPASHKGEDIYDKEQRAINIHPTEEDELKDDELNDDLMGDDLDVPGSELDNDDEAIGSEDEENNYYSIGGDAHTNLDEQDA